MRDKERVSTIIDIAENTSNNNEEALSIQDENEGGNEEAEQSTSQIFSTTPVSVPNIWSGIKNKKLTQKKARSSTESASAALMQYILSKKEEEHAEQQNTKKDHIDLFFGSIKTTTISEMKTKAKRRAREVRYGCQGTAGGLVLPLTPFEERILGLLVSELSVEGAQLSEAAVEMIVAEEELFELPVEIASPSGYVPPQPTPSTEPSQNTQNIDSPPAISTRRRPRRVNRGRAGSRVTTAVELHDRQLAKLARQDKTRYTSVATENEVHAVLLEEDNIAIDEELALENPNETNHSSIAITMRKPSNPKRRGHQAVEIAIAVLMKYLLEEEKNEKEKDDIDLFFDTMKATGTNGTHMGLHVILPTWEDEDPRFKNVCFIKPGTFDKAKEIFIGLVAQNIKVTSTSNDDIMMEVESANTSRTLESETEKPLFDIWKQ
ncbi:unnamed protein product [Diabrotica balteata]|uniref:Uncharacterized protein n=1 Tax=Diabrotica balteata TaxID=107213 RepID=A0A9N9XIJ6_DIABA|nr:unnamed protein product [Diabrotica balteata]